MKSDTSLTPIAKLRDALYEHNSGVVREQESLANRTTYRVGGPAQLLYSPYVEDDIVAAVKYATEWKISHRVLGGGSNLLVSDSGVSGLVIDLKSYFHTIDVSGLTVTADAGCSLLKVVRMACYHGLAGMEKLAGIPGTLGGGIRMNCGAYGMEISDCIEWVRCIDRSGKVVSLKKNEIQWGYRKASELQDMIVIAAGFQLQRANREELFAIIRDVLEQRRSKQPLHYPSAGSVFKRPPHEYAGRLIEVAGLKGARAGDAEVSTQHAGFIVNRGNATATDIFGLIKFVQSEVMNNSGIRLELEQCLWGFEDAEA